MVQKKLTEVSSQKVTHKAEELAKHQREISVSEFFTRNRHLLGFDNPRKALLMVVKEAVDNSFDAWQEMQVLPQILVEIKAVDGKEDQLTVAIEDNGPGIVREQVPRIFGKLLYGSKFGRLKQSLTSDQPIVIKENGNICILPIGEFVDKFLNSEGIEDISHLNIEAPCFDFKSMKYSFNNVSHVIKHQQRNEIYEINLETGRKLKVTGCHSVFSLNKNIEVKEVEARELKENDFLIIPKKLPEPGIVNQIKLTDYINADEIKTNWWYVYGFSKNEIERLFGNTLIIHKKTDKSRKYFQFKINDLIIDVLDDSYKQYVSKGFLPLKLALALNLKFTEFNWIQTYNRGKKTKVPIVWPISPLFMRFLGFYVAEGHCENRKVAFTFNKDETNFVKEIIDFGVLHGMNYNVEHRVESNSTRLTLFGGVLAYLIEKWCGTGAHNKKVPGFIFSSGYENRQHFLDALCQGDGHKFKERNCLSHSTVSKNLANQVLYLWLFQGVLAKQHLKYIEFGITGKPCLSYVTNVYGDDINKSNVFKTEFKTKTSLSKRAPSYLLSEFNFDSKIISKKQIFSELLGIKDPNNNFGKFINSFDLLEQKAVSRHESGLHGLSLNSLEKKGYIKFEDGLVYLTDQYYKLKNKIEKIEQFLGSDLALLRIKHIEKLDLENEWVYDLSVPKFENFVGGYGGIAVHNSLGQQGIGISAAVMYAQLTTGKSAKITTIIGKGKPAHYLELHLDTQKNEPEIVKDEIVKWNKEHGTRIELQIEGKYLKGKQSVDEDLKLISISHPHSEIIYTNPLGEKVVFARCTKQLPVEPKEIKPHPYGVELGILLKMMKATSGRNLNSFLTNDFSRVSSSIAVEISKLAGFSGDEKPSELSLQDAEKLFQAIPKVKIMAPPTNCLSPIGEEQLIEGLKKEVQAEFYAAVTRKPSVYRGFPFFVECAVAYGGDLPGDELISVYRYANKVPLLYQQSACSIYKSVAETMWRNYGLSQSKGALPVAPLVLVVHVASVWVPFPSEGKEVVVLYPEIIKKVKLAYKIQVEN